MATTTMIGGGPQRKLSSSSKGCGSNDRKPSLGLVVFDMAGTTVRVSNEVPVAFLSAFRHVVPDAVVTDEDVATVRGQSKREAIATLLRQQRHVDATGTLPSRKEQEQEVVEAIHDEFQREMVKRFTEEPPAPIDGAERTFAYLRERGVRVALTTGFSRPVTDVLIQSLGWGLDSSSSSNVVVDAILCNDDVAKGRPAPDFIFLAMEQTMLGRGNDDDDDGHNTGDNDVNRVAAVGDTVSDLLAADNAGVRWRLGVLTGAHDRERLASCPNDGILSSVADLPRFFEEAGVLEGSDDRKS